MTAAQWATLEEMRIRTLSAFGLYPRGSFMGERNKAEADALRAALGTCGNCGHASAWPDGALACNNTRGLNREEVGPGESCSGWTAKEGA